MIMKLQIAFIFKILNLTLLNPLDILSQSAAHDDR